MARIMTITRSGMTPEAIEGLISQRMEEVLATQEANRNAGLLDENQFQNRDDNDNGSGGNGICGTKGVVGLARWFEKMESVFHISNCPPNSQVKFDTCTLLDGALTWWNSYVQTIGIDEAYEMRWKDLMKLMIEVYCPRNDIQKLENEMVPEENDKIERFIWGLLDKIQGNVTSSKPARLQDAIRMANGLMDQKVRVYAARNAEQKRKFDNNLRGNRVQQTPFKRQNVA
ncbi:hypothetical protein Tco_1249118 [Tanacetum coccineum]